MTITQADLQPHSGLYITSNGKVAVDFTLLSQALRTLHHGGHPNGQTTAFAPCNSCGTSGCAGGCNTCSPFQPSCPPVQGCNISWTVGPRVSGSNPTVTLTFNGALSNASIPFEITRPDGSIATLIISANANGFGQTQINLNNGDGVYLFTPRYAQCKFSPSCEKVFANVPMATANSGVIINPAPVLPRFTSVECVCENGILVNWMHAGNRAKYRIRINFSGYDDVNYVIPQDTGAKVFSNLESPSGTVELVEIATGAVVATYAFNCCGCGTGTGTPSNAQCAGTLTVIPSFSPSSTINSGDSVTITMTLQNTNQTAVQTVSGAIPLPACLGGGTFTIPANLTINANQTLQLTQTVTGTNTASGVVTCQVVVSSSMGTYKCGGSVFAISGGQAAISVTGSTQTCGISLSALATPSNVPFGGTFQYKVTVTNTGNTAATGISFPALTLPANVTGAPVTFTLATLAPAATQTFTFVLTNGNTTSGALVNAIQIPANHMTAYCGGGPLSHGQQTTTVTLQGNPAVSPVDGVSPVNPVSPVSPVSPVGPACCLTQVLTSILVAGVPSTSVVQGSQPTVRVSVTNNCNTAQTIGVSLTTVGSSTTTFGPQSLTIPANSTAFTDFGPAGMNITGAVASNFQATGSIQEGGGCAALTNTISATITSAAVSPVTVDAGVDGVGVDGVAGVDGVGVSGAVDGDAVGGVADGVAGAVAGDTVGGVDGVGE